MSIPALIRFNLLVFCGFVAVFLYGCSISPPPFWALAIWLPLLLAEAFVLGVAQGRITPSDPIR